MKHYFIIFQLPGSASLKKFSSTCKNFRRNAAEMIQNGTAKIISQRQDTGCSEEFRDHIMSMGEFKTYLIMNLHLEKEVMHEEAIFVKASDRILKTTQQFIVDTAANFQLIAVN